MQSAGANVLLVAAIPKFAAQSIRKVYDLNWKPTFFMTNVAISVGGVMTPAGPEKGVGILSTAYLKDPTDLAFRDDAGMNEWRDFMTKYMPSADVTDLSYVFAYGVSKTMLQVLKQCNGDFSRPNVMQQAESLNDLGLPILLPGIKVSTSHTDHRPIKSMQFMRWDGKMWVRFGDLISGATV
jgi:branched-chain amino acid transport system substrate-binding protein